MGVYRFEDLRVWQAAKKQADAVGRLMKRPDFLSDRKLTDQMNDASISVSNNISEGFLRRRDGETMQHLRYSFASNGELRNCFHLALGRNYLAEGEAGELMEANASISKMLRRWMATLEDPNKKRRGPRTQDQERTKDQGPGPKDRS
jgi:four helix bundle protein